MNMNKDLKAALYVYPAAFVIVLVAVAGLISQNTYAGEPPNADRCYDVGYQDGRNNPFSATTFEECDTESKFKDGQNQYKEGFLDGCKSVEGNKEEECKAHIE
jgi:hypothetical protein